MRKYKNFYKKEIIVREKLNYPPFCDIILGVLSGQNDNEVKEEAEKFASAVRATGVPAVGLRGY